MSKTIEQKINDMVDKFEKDLNSADSLSKGLEIAFDNLDFDLFIKLYESKKQIGATN